MKNFALILLCATMVSFVSCRKNRTCNCIHANTGVIQSSTNTTENVLDVTKKEGVEACDLKDTTFSYEGITTNIDCSLVY
ncbi:hypothetical protein DNU06_08720 [Putridiphycobacter roseus]|uniref:Uncharacterized protein n=1 Tax=Putridiphycobacter roseus TaxID=2219161 RepID=A0A2W1NE09_9FLAO|nr:hypothetical protein [Putridiphycobacter roseus]PZE17343.1 hypothetical protein DNU06_08720 [Putridiphycobacter roseus]